MSSPESDSSSSSSTVAASDDTSNDHQECFVLHRAQFQKAGCRSPGSKTSRRRTEPKSLKKPDRDLDLRLEVFNLVWSKIETTINDVLRRHNLDLFTQVQCWVQESFSEIKSLEPIAVAEIQKPYPLITDVMCKLIPTALILTKNVEFVDDLLTFQELGEHLRSQKCHVASLSALDFSRKHGITGSVRSLLRLLIHDAPDVADVSMLASWYCEPTNYGQPLIVMIDDSEQCDGCVLSEFITMLSEWMGKIPIILIMGVATAVDALRRLLKSGTLQRLRPCKFSVASPYEIVNAIVETVLVRTCFGFSIGYRVAIYLKNFFQKHDGTITAYIRALKVACLKHFAEEPLSFLCEGMLYEDSEFFWSSKCRILPDPLLTHASEFDSCRRDMVLAQDGNTIAKGLLQLKRLSSIWSVIVMCLFEVAKLTKMQLLDIFLEAIDPLLFKSSDPYPETDSYCEKSLGGTFDIVKGGFIAQTIQKVRELPLTSLCSLLEVWELHSEKIMEIHQRIKEFNLVMGPIDGNGTLRSPNSKKSKSHILGKPTQRINHEAAELLETLVRKFLVPIECVPYQEIVCFNHVEVLQSALVGDPRKIIQVDLLKASCLLQCNCCSRSRDMLSPTMHDTSILYNLAQEYSDLINLHDWYQSFKTTLVPKSTAKRKVHSPLTKKVKATPQESEALIQARFCRAVTELHISGLIRMAGKRRPDFAYRVAFGV